MNLQGTGFGGDSTQAQTEILTLVIVLAKEQADTREPTGLVGIEARNGEESRMEGVQVGEA